MGLRLLILAPNWLGDAVMALPAVADVRRGLPEATIAVAARAAVAPLYAMVPDLNETIVIGRGAAPALRDASFDAALVLPNSFRAAFIAWRARVPERWGYRTDWRGPLLTRAIEAPVRVHQVEYYQQLVRALGFPSGPSAPRVAVDDATRAAGDAALRRAGWDGRAPFVALAPGAAYGAAKRWPPASFAELARHLASDGFACAMVGSAADAATGREIEEAPGTPVRVLNLIGATDLGELAGVLANARGVVSNDSGAMHLAAAVGVPVVAIFGPTDETVTSPGGPLALSPEPLAILRHAVWCRPCMLRECPLDHACMTGVTVGAVLDATRRVL